MPIEKRYFNYGKNVLSYLTCFATDEDKARLHIEDSESIQFVDLTADELKEFICDLNFILKDINEENELH
jgi:hypothetical protein